MHIGVYLWSACGLLKEFEPDFALPLAFSALWRASNSSWKLQLKATLILDDERFVWGKNHFHVSFKFLKKNCWKPLKFRQTEAFIYR